MICENSTKARANIETKQFIKIQIYYLKENLPLRSFKDGGTEIGKVKNRLDGLLPTGFKRSKDFLLKIHFVKSLSVKTAELVVRLPPRVELLHMLSMNERG